MNPDRKKEANKQDTVIISQYNIGKDYTIPTSKTISPEEKSSTPALEPYYKTTNITEPKARIEAIKVIKPPLASEIEHEILPGIGRFTDRKKFKLTSPDSMNYFHQHIFTDRIYKIHATEGPESENIIIETTANSLVRQIEKDKTFANFDKIKGEIKFEADIAISHIWHKIQLLSLESKFVNNLQQQPLLKPIFLYREMRQSKYTNIAKQYSKMKSSQIKDRTIREIKGLNNPLSSKDRLVSNIKKIPEIIIWGGTDPDEKTIYRFLSELKKWLSQVGMNNCLEKIDCRNKKVKDIFFAIDKSFNNLANCANYQLEQIAGEKEIEEYERIQENIYSINQALSNLKKKKTYIL